MSTSPDRIRPNRRAGAPRRARHWTRLLALGVAISLHPFTRGAELAGSPFELDAAAGEIVRIDQPAPHAPASIEGAVRFLELRDLGRWAPSAFVGIEDGERRGKFRVFITQTEPGGGVVAGYDYVLDGALVHREALVKHIPRSAAVHLALAWTPSGSFSVSFFGEPPRTVETALSPEMLFAAASSARAKFVLEAVSYF